jgi:putative adhesin
MNPLMRRVLMNAVWLGLAATVCPQTPGTDHVTVPFSDPSRPGTVKVNLISGSITVKGYAGKEVVVDVKSREEAPGNVGAQSPRPEAAGLKRIPNSSTALTVEEDSNVISVAVSPFRPANITLQVPSRTTLKLRTINQGQIQVEQVQGEIEVNNINGGVNLTQVSGSVVAHALNGIVKVVMVGVEANKPMSFSSLNGDIDVTFPADIKANVSMKSDNGEIYSDFDIKIDSNAAKPGTEEERGKGGKYKIKIDRTTRGTINGGGPEIQFKTFNGNIYIRKYSK